MYISKRVGRAGVVVLAAAFMLIACGKDSTKAGGTGQMSLSIGDAPVDGAQAVVLKFTGVELTGNSGNPVIILFDPAKSIDILNQSGTASAVLFDQQIPAGSYNQLKLTVVADGDAANSYIQLSDGTMHGLLVPSGAQNGLKLITGFSVPTNGVANYAVDFDLRKSVTCPQGQAPACLLKPVNRLVDNTAVGAIQGSIGAALVPVGCHPGVYLYSGSVSAPEDMNSAAAASDTNQPLASRTPIASSPVPYHYQFPFLEPGSYTLALSCQADLDDPDLADAAVTFAPVKTGITVTATQTANADLP